MENEDTEHGQGPDGEEESSPSDEIAYAVADLLRSDATRGWIEAKTRNLPADASMKQQSMWLGVGFSVVVFIGVGFLGYVKVISGDSTTALIGGLIGYWFGQRQRTN
jgi:hypothetical protein